MTIEMILYYTMWALFIFEVVLFVGIMKFFFNFLIDRFETKQYYKELGEMRRKELEEEIRKMNENEKKS
jgi:biopolymer transport protein ExbB/TolQ